MLCVFIGEIIASGLPAFLANPQLSTYYMKMNNIDSQEYWAKRHSFTQAKWLAGIGIIIPLIILTIYLFRGETIGIVIALGMGGLFFLWQYSYERSRFIQPRIDTAREASKTSGKYIDDYIFPQGITQNIKKKYVHLTDIEIAEVLKLLKEYFHMCNIATIGAASSESISKEKEILCVGMPSKIVDDAWHELILFTREYADFCEKALGKFLHHTPSSALSNTVPTQTAIQNAWRIACHRSELNPVSTSELPAIFKIDEKLSIKDGFIYKSSELTKKQNKKNAKGSCGGGGHYEGSNGFGCSSSGSDPSNCGLGGCSSSCSGCGGE